MKKLIASILLTASVCSFAQSNSSIVCSWGVMHQFDKSTAAQGHCNAFAGPNGFRADPERANWINACRPIVNQAVANCNDTDLPCMKAVIPPLQPQICALNQRFQTVKK